MGSKWQLVKEAFSIITADNVLYVRHVGEVNVCNSWIDFIVVKS